MLSRNNVINFFLLHTQAHCLPTPLPAPLLNIITPNGPDWTSHAFSSLFSSIIHMYGASPSTWNTYSAGQQCYLTFCAKAHRKALPTSESALRLFVSHLADTGLTHSTIKVYLSSVHHLHVTQGQHSQFSKQLTPCLQQVLKGIKKVQAATTHPRVCRPITLEIMQGIKSVLLSLSHSYQNTMIWAACCLAFFGFLRSSNFTVPAQDHFDNSTHLSPQDIAIDCQHSPSMIKVRIKQSMTDPFRQGVDLYLGKMDKDICPVRQFCHTWLSVATNRDHFSWALMEKCLPVRHSAQS